MKEEAAYGYCKNPESHQFFEVQKATEVDKCIVQCAVCGEVRALSSGEYVVIKEGWR